MSSIVVGPLLKVTGKLLVGHYERLIDRTHWREVIEHVLHHRLAGNGQQRLGLIQC